MSHELIKRLYKNICFYFDINKQKKMDKQKMDLVMTYVNGSDQVYVKKKN